mmetsp:Transcript_25181/g.54786  ORF Transcript_25181/g.54786 Transcript_25181/m.54786 type:complete len:83 (-) Transcript_25181:1211-1459(-)
MAGGSGAPLQRSHLCKIASRISGELADSADVNSSAAELSDPAGVVVGTTCDLAARTHSGAKAADISSTKHPRPRTFKQLLAK